MRRFEIGDLVRIDIPEQADPDHDRLHGRRGRIVNVLQDDAGQETGDQRDAYLFSVELVNGTVEDLRWRDLRPASESD